MRRHRLHDPIHHGFTMLLTLLTRVNKSHEIDIHFR